jgi:ADP-ribosylglycohydrolase
VPAGPTLAIGLCALNWLGDDDSGVAWAISLGGDTDTNAAVTGTLLGYRHGAARFLNAGSRRSLGATEWSEPRGHSLAGPE